MKSFDVGVLFAAKLFEVSLFEKFICHFFVNAYWNFRFFNKAAVRQNIIGQGFRVT